MDLYEDVNSDKQIQETEQQIDIDYYCRFLNDNQEVVLRECLIGDRKKSDVAKELGITPSRVTKLIKEIKEVLINRIERNDYETDYAQG